MNFLPLIPIVVPLLGAGLTLLARRQRVLQLIFALGALSTALIASISLVIRLVADATPIVYQLGGWLPPMGITLVADRLSAIFVLMSLFVLLCALLYTIGGHDKAFRFPAFLPLLLTLTTSLCGGLLTGDVFNFFVFAELLVISASVLTSLSDDKGGPEAAWKYFYISTFAGLLLLGASGCLYAAYGTLNMADLSRLILAQPAAPLLKPAAAMLVAAMLIKAAVIPFHFWQPDFHTVSPTPISAVLSSVVVKLGVYGMARLTTLILLPMRQDLQNLMVLLGLVGVVAGGFAAAGTHNAKRVLAYSTLAQIGFIFVAMGLGTEAGLAAAIVFAVNHALVKSALLMLAGAVASRAPVKSASFSVVTGVGRTSPLAGALFLLGAMALIGMPPTNGFIGKLAVLTATADTSRTLLVVVLCVASVLTLLYMARSYLRIWWEPLPPETEAELMRKPRGKKPDALLAPAILILTCLVLGLFPAPLSRLAASTATYLQTPAIYIHAVFPPSVATPPRKEGLTP